MSSASGGRTLPKPSPETQHFWDGTRVGELRLQRCRGCATVYFPPQPMCPACLSDEIDIMVATGSARLYSYVISHLPSPGFTPPFVLAVVELAEGPRMLTNLVGIDPEPETLPLDLELQVVFEEFGDVTLPLFTPAVVR